MAIPVTKEQALRNMRVMWFAFIMSVVLYLYVGTTLSPKPSPAPAMTIFILPAALDFLWYLWFRLKRYVPALRSLQSQPDDAGAIRRWTAYWVILLAMAEAEILFGLACWMVNGRFTPCIAFFALGSLLLLSLWPRQVWSSSEIPTE
ncbi:MAG: hypothetical protein WAN10_07760 [Candidatus Acidiferrales bacterium]